MAGATQTVALMMLMTAGAAWSQTRENIVGMVSKADANVSTRPGHPLEVSAAGRVLLVGSSSIVARDHSAPIELLSGGTLLLCRTSSLNLSGATSALAVGLNRGAMELRMEATGTDAILTPDLRITAPAGGPLDLRMRVSPNGDTCIENRGRRAPQLQLNEVFGQATYVLRSGQHVLFEHGSLREVVDRETTPCGCPPDDPHVVPLTKAQVQGTQPVTPAQAAAANPFPATQSAGLAPPPALPADKAGETQTQISTTIAFDPTAARPTTMAAPLPEPPPPPAESHNPFRAIGRFFRRLFAR